MAYWFFGRPILWPASRQFGEKSNPTELRSNLDRSYGPLKFCPIWTEFQSCSFLVLSIRFSRPGQFDKRDRSGIIGHIGRIGWIDLGIFHDDVEQKPERKAFHVVPLGQTVIGNLVEVPQHHAVGIHDPDQNIHRQVKGGIAVFQFHQKLRRRAFPFLFFFCKVPDKLQDMVMHRRFGILEIGTNQVPTLFFQVEPQTEMQVFNVPARAVKIGKFGKPFVLLQHERGIGTAHQSCGSGDHVEGIGRRLLACVVDQENGNVETVCYGFQNGHGAVVPGVTVVFGFHVPDLLKRIDQHEVDRRVLCEEIHELLIQTVSDHLRFCHDPDPSGVAVGHIYQTALDTGEGIFQTEVQHLPLPAVEIPDRLPGENAVRHQ